MNPSALLVCMLVLSATVIGAASFHEVADRYYSSQLSPEALRCPASAPTTDKAVMGHSETVFLGEERRLVYDAKVDSGAETSSLHASSVEAFQKSVMENGVPKKLLHVRFTTEDDRGARHTVERLVSRIDQVRSASGTHSRYFFHETVWINDRSFQIEVNLADRTGLSKKMLIGRNLLNQGYLVDTTGAYLATPSLTAR